MPTEHVAQEQQPHWRVLDLDVPSSWDGAFPALVYEDETWTQVKARLDAGEDEWVEFMRQFVYERECVKDTLAGYLCDKAREILLQEHTHVAGYHGCRVADRRSYQQNGILPSNPEMLIAWARERFAGIAGFEDALQDINALDRLYVRYNEGKVGLLISGTWAKRKRCHYVQGSELICTLANRLGAEAKRRVIETGRPMLIKCAIPVNWLDSHTTFPVLGGYANEVVAQLIGRRVSPQDQYEGCDGGYLLTRGVPPQNIIEFIDMTDSCNDVEWAAKPKVVPWHLRATAGPVSS